MERLPHGPVTLAELTAGLIWPKLLRSAAMALRPVRLVLAYAMVLAIAGFSDLFVWLMGDRAGAKVPREIAQSAETGWFWASREFAAFSWSDAPAHLWSGFVSGPLDAAGKAPWSAALYAAMLVVPVSVFGCAISRSAALEVGPRLDASAPESLLFALRRWRSLLAIPLVPPIFVLALGAVIAALGYAMFRITGVSAVTSVFFGALLPLGVVLVGLIACYALGWLLLIPAVACDGCDAADAIQRAYAYVLGRPGRLLVYSAVLLLQGLIAFGVTAWLLDAVFSLTDHLATRWLPADVAALVNDRSAAQVHPAAAVVRFWSRAFGLLLPAYALSYLFSGSTILYLLVRRVNDEHDEHDVWLERAPASRQDATPTAGGSFE